MSWVRITRGRNWCQREGMAVGREGGLHSLLSPTSRDGSRPAPRWQVNPAALKGRNRNAAMAREGGRGSPSRSARAGCPAKQLARKGCHERERERRLVGLASSWGRWRAPLPKLAVDASRKSGVPGLEVVPSCHGSLSRTDLASVPEEGRGAPSESAGPGFLSLLAGAVKAAMAACLRPRQIWPSASLPGTWEAWASLPVLPSPPSGLLATIPECLVVCVCASSQPVVGRVSPGERLSSRHMLTVCLAPWVLTSTNSGGVPRK